MKPQNNDVPRVAIYGRVSTEGQRGADGIRVRGQTVEPQLLELRGYCQRHGWTTATEYTDVMSGLRDKRPGLDALLAAVEAGEVDLVLVVKLDRLGRSLVNIIRLIESMAKKGCAVVCTSQAIDTRKDSPMGRMVIQIMGAFAEFERNLIAERTVAGMAAARARGVVLGRVSPTMVAASERPAVVAAWRAGGCAGGVRGLGRMLGGCSSATSARLAKSAPEVLAPLEV